MKLTIKTNEIIGCILVVGVIVIISVAKACGIIK